MPHRPNLCDHGDYPERCDICGQAAEVVRLQDEVVKLKEDRDEWMKVAENNLKAHEEAVALAHEFRCARDAALKPVKQYDVTITGISGWGKHWTESTDPENPPPVDGGFVIGWSCKGIGFGETTVSMRGEVIKCDTECMSPEFIAAVFKKLFEGEFKDGNG